MIRIGKLGNGSRDVQSGKTSNYTGLVAKALDTGYKMIK